MTLLQKNFNPLDSKTKLNTKYEDSFTHQRKSK